MNTTKNIVNAIQDATQRKRSAYDTTATVKRIEGDTAWVHIPGGVDETPVSLTISASIGDTVQVRVGGGKAWITGNSTVPPTGDAEAIAAKLEAELAKAKAINARKISEEAVATAHNAQTIAESNLIYDHSYHVEESTAIFTAYLYVGGQDVTEQYSDYYDEIFSWYIKNESLDDGAEEYLGSGRTCEVDLSTVEYGSVVVGYFTIHDSEILSSAISNDI